jgi:hypothetical protein
MSTEPFLCALDISLTTKHIDDRIDDGRFTQRKLYKKRHEANQVLWDRGMEVINDRLEGKTMSIGGPNNPDVLDRMLNTIDKGMLRIIPLAAHVWFFHAFHASNIFFLLI